MHTDICEIGRGGRWGHVGSKVGRGGGARVEEKRAEGTGRGELE